MTLGRYCLGARVELQRGSPSFLHVMRPPQPRGDGIVLQIQLYRVTDTYGGVEESSAGAPRVLCNLNAGQAAEVEAHGVPQSLKDAMLAATTGNWMGWSGPGPLPPDI